jgi:hypothetical protein
MAKENNNGEYTASLSVMRLVKKEEIMGPKDCEDG